MLVKIHKTLLSTVGDCGEGMARGGQYQFGMGPILPMEYIVRCHLINGMACGSTYTTHGMVFDSHRADTTFGMSQRILPMA